MALKKEITVGTKTYLKMVVLIIFRMANGHLPNNYSPEQLVDEIVNEIRFQCTFGKSETILEAFREFFFFHPQKLELLYAIYRKALGGKLPGPENVEFFDEMEIENIEFFIDAKIPEVTQVIAREQMQ